MDEENVEIRDSPRQRKKESAQAGDKVKQQEIITETLLPLSVDIK